ncbi:MAG: DUF2231 domain-containing protein [Methylococcales bacterium]|nr:DUF2231 domain-containing protein [Methylococcales bacterium]
MCNALNTEETTLNTIIDTINFLSFQIHGSAAGHKSSDGVAGYVEAFLTFLESLIGLSPTEIFAKILPGITSMANIHPIIVHFPIALLIAFFIVDLFGILLRKDNWRGVASGLLYLGTIGAGAAVAAGLIAARTVDHGENVHLILAQHEFIGISILSISALLSIWRLLSGGIVKGASNIFYTFTSAILTLLIVLGADLGGLMVYKYGVAVDAVKVTSLDYFKEHTHSH